MKVFGCTTQLPYSGGIILVAANTVEEAFLLAASDDNCYYIFDWHDGNNYIEPDGNINHVDSDCFPFNSWKEYDEISTNVTEPTILIAEFYYE